MAGIILLSWLHRSTSLTESNCYCWLHCYQKVHFYICVCCKTLCNICSISAAQIKISWETLDPAWHKPSTQTPLQTKLSLHCANTFWCHWFPSSTNKTVQECVKKLKVSTCSQNFPGSKSIWASMRSMVQKMLLGGAAAMRRLTLSETILGMVLS